MIRTEIAVADGHVVLLISDPEGGAMVEILMDPDEARSYVNALGEAILRLTPIGVMA